MKVHIVNERVRGVYLQAR